MGEISNLTMYMDNIKSTRCGVKPGLQPSQLALRSCYAGVIVVVNINRDREHKHKYNREPIGRVCTLQTFPMLLHDRELAQL